MMRDLVDTRGPASIADYRPPVSGGEHPFVQAFPGVTEGRIQRDAVAGPEPSREIEKLWTRTWGMAAARA